MASTLNSSKLIGILRTFSKSEMKEFEKFVCSPFFNGGRNYMPFFNQLKKFYPKFDDDKLTPEYIYSKMYPDKEFNKQIIWNLTSSMLNMAEEYLMYVLLRRKDFERNKLIADELLNRHLSAYSMKKLNDMEKILDNMGYDDNYFKYKMQLEADRVEVNFYDDNQHLLTDNLRKQGEYTILNFLKSIAGIISDMNSNIVMFNARYDVNIPYRFMENMDLKGLVEYAKENNFEHAAALEMYYCDLMMILNPDEPMHFFRLKELLDENYSKFSSEENHIWTNMLSNYCSIRRDKGDTRHDYKRFQFEIHKFELREGIAFPERNPSKILFIQILKNALLNGETEWVKNYIEEYIPLLRTSYQKPMRALGYAYLYLKLKEYDKVFENLGKVNFSDVRDKLNVRSIYIITYYELNDIETLLMQIDSAKHFINKNPGINDWLRKFYNGFLNNVNKLMIAKEKDDEFEIERLRKTIETEKGVIFREWLLEKINELKKELVV